MEVDVRSSVSTTSLTRVVLVVAAVGAAGGCASRKVEIAQESISSQAPFSRTFQGSGDTVCWGVKRQQPAAARGKPVGIF